MPRFCNLVTKVWNVRKSQVERYNEVRRLATKLHDGCMYCVHGALGRCTFKT